MTKSGFQKHTMSKNEAQSHVCEYCNKIVKRSDSLKKHVKLCQQKHLKTKQQELFSCDLCIHTFKSKHTLGNHK